MKRTFLYLLTPTIILLFGSLNLFSNDLQNGWEAFKNNNFEEAAKHFESAKQNKELKEQALLSLISLELLNSSRQQQDLLLSHVNEYLETAKDPDPYIMSLWSSEFFLNPDDPYSENLWEVYNTLLNNDKISARLKYSIRDAASRIYERQNNFEKAIEMKASTGGIAEWQIIGSFENISASGYDKNFPPIEHPKNDFDFKNKDNTSIKWFKAKGWSAGDWIRFAYHVSITNSICYAQTFCKSDIKQNVQFRIGASGSIKLWLNDDLIFEDEEERNTGIDAFIINTELSEGYNRILVQIGSSEISSSNFLLRITDKDGEPIRDLTYSPEFRQYPENAAIFSEVLDDPHEMILLEDLEKSEEKLLSMIYLINYYKNANQFHKAYQMLEKAESIAPENIKLLQLKEQLYIFDGNSTAAAMIKQQIKEAAPDLPASIILEIDEAANEKDYDKMETLAEKYIRFYGHDLTIDRIHTTILALNKQFEELIEFVDECYKRYPYSQFFVITKHRITNQSNDNDKALDILEDYLDDYFNFEIFEIRLDFLSDLGETEEMLESLEERLKKVPYLTGTRKYHGDQFSKLRQYDKAIQVYRQCLEYAPFISTYYGSIGYAYENLGNKDSAIVYLEKALVYDNNVYDYIDKLHKLKNKKQPLSYFEEVDYDQLLKEAPNKDKFPDDNTIYLHDEVRSVVYPNGASVQLHSRMLKAFNEDGVDDIKEYSIYYEGFETFNIEKAYTYKANGRKIDAETNKNHVVFTNLEPGDAVVLVYKLNSYKYGKLAGHFWTDFYLNYFDPIVKSKYSLMVPKGFEFNFKVLNDDIIPTIEEWNEYLVYSWETNNEPAIKYESAMPTTADVCKRLVITTFPDWKFVVDWYNDISKTKAKPDFEVKKKVAELFEGKENLSDMEKVQILYDFVVKDIRYSYVGFRQSGIIPQKPSDLLITKLGDCKDVSTLFNSMCKAAGFDSHIVLVSSQSNGNNYLPLPSIDFNHAISCIEIDGKEYYVELTGDHLPFSTISGSNKNSTVLKIDPECDDCNTLSLDPPTRKPNVVTRFTDAVLDADKISVSTKTLKIGGPAGNSRLGLKNTNLDTQIEYVMSEISSFDNNLKVDELMIDKNLYSTCDTLSYKYDYTVSEPYTVISGMQIFRVPISGAYSPADFLNSQNRENALDISPLTNTDYQEEIINIIIPENKEIVELPSNVTIQNDFGEYSLNFELQQDRLMIKRRTSFKANIIPVAKFNQFRKFYNEIVTADKTQIAIKEKK